MKTLIILLCLLVTAIIGYQIASAALTISSGKMSVSSGVLNVLAISSDDVILWDASNDVIYWDASGDSILWD